MWQILCLLSFLLPGCIREDRSACLPEEKERLVVLKVVDAATGRDITESGEAGNAVLYLFSPEGVFTGQIPVDGEHIRNRWPIPLSCNGSGRSYVCVWTNAGNGQHFHSPSDERWIGGRAVSLTRNSGEYHGTPDDLFFGYMRLAAEGGVGPEEVTVMRKNARMHITVRGLDRTVSQERYYFTVRTPNDGYDFAGNPSEGRATVCLSGEFDTAGDFSTPDAFNLIHTDPVSAGEVSVCLYERVSVRTADRLVVSTIADDGGRPISLPAGQTVNLLIDIREGTGVSIRMEITPWNEVYQWDVW